MRIQALRASESIYKAGDRSFAADWRALAQDPDADVVIQAMLTMQVVKVPDTAAAARLAMASHTARGVQFVGDRIVNPPANAAGGGRSLTPDQQAIMARGSAIYSELCFSCHGEDGRGTPVPGRARGRRDGAVAVGIGPRQRTPRLRHQAAAARDVRTDRRPGLSPGHGAHGREHRSMGRRRCELCAQQLRELRDVGERTGRRARSRGGVTRKTQWTLGELEASLPRPLIPDSAWKVTASHNSSAAPGALDYARWTSDVPQQPGMWLQVALPQSIMLAEIEFDSPPIAGGRGGTAPTGTFPRGYRVEVSTDGKTWSAVAEGQGSGRITSIAFAPVRASVVRITQTAPVENGPVWSVERLRLYEAAISR